MASRSKAYRRPEYESDSMEAIKPLVVLVLLGTILYGAYSVVQKGNGQSSPSVAGVGTPGPIDAAEAPPFAPPQVDLAPEAAAPAAAQAARPPFEPSAPPLDPMTPPAGAVAAAAVAGAIPPAAMPVAVAPSAGVPEPATTYLSAVSAPPPGLDQARTAEPAAVPTSFPAAAAAAAPAEAAARSSAVRAQSTAFASAWADAHEKLAAGRYAEALAVLSVWYDDPSLGLEESQRLEELLGQLAGTVIYSQQDLLLPPHIVGPQETLPGIASQLSIPWQLLAKINGIDDPDRLVEGEPLKLVRGPFDAVVGISRRRLSLQVGGNYAGSFPVVVGRQVQERVGASLSVVEVRRADPGRPTAATQVSFVASGQPAILLGDGMTIESVEDPAALGDNAPASSLIIAARDLREIIDILGPGSHVLIRQ